MGKLYARLAIAALLTVAARDAHAGDPLKPYVVLALDTSGSMDTATGFGSPSCGGLDTRLNHAKCAIYNIVNSYGDMVFALGRFRMTMSGTFPACTSTGAGASGSATCDGSANMFELLSPLVDGNNDLAGVWVDGTQNTCTAVGTDPEIWQADGNTPLAGTLVGTKRYWSGLQAPNFTIWPSGQPGFNPIVNDPTATGFLPSGCDPSPTCTVNCCASQCRPYIVILLTDGDETCVAFTPNTTNAAAALLATDVSTGAPATLRRYHVQTRPIGFGIAAGYTPIEDIAHAGGAVDVPGVNEGFYAQNEAELQLAISSILADAIKTESCNNLDDDCDAAVDEDFPGKGGACDNGKLGVCRRTGSLVCRADGTGLQCNAPAGPAPGTEICNTLDDDCDGKIDEGLTGCTCIPQGETCNNLDDDCDGKIDEGIQRPCGTGTCQGTETCMAGVFTGCTAQVPTTEVCNGLDDNCDGVRDGFTQACSDMAPVPPFPAGDPRNNPGDPSHMPIPQNICHPGNRICPANVGPPNAFGPCLGEQQPLTEVCNGLDDDCDNLIDEGQCSPPPPCIPGEFPCAIGRICVNNVCIPDVCFGVVCPDASGNKQVCIRNGNTPQCVSACDPQIITCSPPQICYGPTGTCRPDDCTTFPDRCATNEVCVNGACASNPCSGVNCPSGQYCVAGSCIASCADVECPTGKRCRMGMCEADPCKKPCPFGRVCNDESGKCVQDPCEFTVCSPGQECDPNHGGICVNSPCAGTTCPHVGEICKLGTCNNPADFRPDEYVTTGGGGGCATSGDERCLVVAVALLFLRRRREVRR